MFTYQITDHQKKQNLGFQIKLNLKVIVTNTTLFGFGLVDTDKCTFCNLQRETLVNLFCLCSHVVLFQENVCS